MELRDILMSSRERDRLFLRAHALGAREMVENSSLQKKPTIWKEGKVSRTFLRYIIPLRLWRERNLQRVLWLGAITGAFSVGLVSLKTSVWLSALIAVAGEAFFWSPRERRCKLTLQRRQHLALYLKNVVTLLEQGWDIMVALRRAAWQLPEGQLRNLLARAEMTEGDIIEQAMPPCGVLEALRDRDARILASAIDLVVQFDDPGSREALKRLSCLLEERCRIFKSFARSCQYTQRIVMVCGGLLGIFALVCAVLDSVSSEYNFMMLSTTRGEVGIILSILTAAAIMRLASPLTWGIGDDE